jgi:hypothetical protein
MMATKLKEKDSILEIIGNPNDVDRELRDFRKSAMVLSSKQHHLIQEYPEEWVAIYEGKVKAHGKSHELVLKKVDGQGIPRRQILVRFISKKPRAMIL